MHSNKLPALPTNFQSLQFLRTLNLSKNNFRIDILDIISNITTLTDIYLAHNAIQGPIPVALGNLGNLQILDLEGNEITSLPDSIRKLRKMRILLLGENHLSELPWGAFEEFPDLYELDVYSNRLAGDLLPTAIEKLTLSSLSMFDIHSNGLTSLPSNLHLPSLTQFNATQNEITTTGTFLNTTPRLVHLSLGQNQLSVLPEGVLHLSYLRSLDISNNMIEHIDPRLGFLERLTTFLWMGNLIRIRAWGSLDTEGIKSALRAKADEEAMKILEDGVGDLDVNACRGECTGTLNLTAKLEEMPLTEEMISEHLHPAHFPSLTKIIVQQNKLTVVPSLIGIAATITTLDLSKNVLSSSVFDNPVTLDSLIYLDLSANRLEKIDMLPNQLSAPALKTLDISFNCISSIIPLRSHYPLLRILHANSNQIAALEPNDIDGLEIVQVNNNSINKLAPELGKVESLRILGVDGNTFRVPGRRVLDGGTAGLLEWLKSRCVEP
jgi:Leucine-rich repeat (LRR) protein